MKINKLTKEQESQIQQYYDEWYKIGTCTAPADRQTAEKAVIGMLKYANEYNNQKIVWCDSPLVAEIMINILANDKIGDSLDGSLRDSLGDSLMDSLGDSLRASLWDSLGDSLGASLMDSLDGSLRDSLRNSLRDSLGDSLRDSLRNSLRNSLGDSLRASLSDSLGASLVASLGASLRASLSDSLSDSLGDSLSDSLWASLRASLSDSLRASLRASLGDSLGDSLRDSLRDSLSDSLEDSLRASLSDSLGASLWGSLWDSLWGSLWDSLWDSLKKTKLKYYGTWFDGYIDSYWVCFYKFCRDVVGVKYDDLQNEKLSLHIDLCKSAGKVYFFKNMVLICERPSELHFVNKKLHKNGSPAVKHRDGFSIWALNGIRVPQWLAETPDGELKINQYNDLKNADHRTEFVRKFGVDRMLSMGKKIDSHENYSEEWWTKSEYELWDLHCLFAGIDFAPHVKMKNLTTGTIHVEAVSPKSDTLPKAIKERLNNKELKIKEIK